VTLSEVTVLALNALMGVAGGELLIPTIVLLFAVDIKIAGGLSLIISLPTMLVAFARYSRDNNFQADAVTRRPPRRLIHQSLATPLNHHREPTHIEPLAGSSGSTPTLEWLTGTRRGIRWPPRGFGSRTARS
jgi:hypothetical protein